MKTVTGLVVVLAWLGVGCGREVAPQGGERAPAAVPTFYAVKGVVLGLEPAKRTVRIRHEAIPGYMAAMTMPFDVKDTNELAGIAAGDIVTFRMWVTEEEGWIDQVKKVGTDPSVLPHEREPVRRVPLVEPLALGDEVPDYRLTNQFGQPLELRDFRGRALGLTFIFTRCPYPNFCPRQNRQFDEVSQRLKQTAGLSTNWTLLTISFDPEHDTPAVLRELAERLNYDPAHWVFATGSQADIDALTEQFGVQVGREGDLFSHNIRTAVIDASGRVHTNMVGNEWSVDDMAAAMVRAAKMR